MIRFEIVRASKGQFRPKVVAANGKLLFWGEAYRRRAGAVKALRLLQPACSIYDVTRKVWINAVLK